MCGNGNPIKKKMSSQGFDSSLIKFFPFILKGICHSQIIFLKKKPWGHGEESGYVTF